MSLNTSSNDLLRHDLFIHLKRNIGSLFTILGIFLVLIPFATAAVPGDSIFNMAIQQQFELRLINEYLSVIVYFAAAGAGLVFGVLHFAFLRDISRAEFFFLIGIRRDKLYLSRLLAGVIEILISLLVPMLISLGLNVAAYGSSPLLFRCFVSVTGGLLLQAFLGFLLAVLACELAGTFIEIIMYLLMLFGGFFGMVYGINQILYHVVWDNHGISTLIMRAEAGSNLLAKLIYFNPLTFYLKQMVNASAVEQGASATLWPNLFIVWGVICLGLIFLARNTLKIRHIEQSGQNGCRIQVTRIVIFLSMFILFAVIFVLLDQSNRIFALAVALFADLILYIIWQQAFIHQHPGAWVLASRCLTMLVAVVVVFVIIFGAGTQTRKRLAEEGKTPVNQETLLEEDTSE